MFASVFNALIDFLLRLIAGAVPRYLATSPSWAEAVQGVFTVALIQDTSAAASCGAS
jgi:hypothetical protein